MADLNLVKAFLEAKEEASKTAEEMQAKRRALMPKFDTERAALDYIKRLVAIKPGDVVKISNQDDSALIEVVFTGAFDSDGHPVLVGYNPENQRLLCACTSWHGIVL